MRHRRQQEQDQVEERGAEGSTLIRVARPTPPAPGRHRAPASPAPFIPLQQLPTHDQAPRPTVAPVALEVPQMREVQEVLDIKTPVQAPLASERARANRLSGLTRPLLTQAPPQPAVPQTGQWKASHLPRTVAAVALAGSVVGTAVLGLRYIQTSSSDNLVSLVVGIAVVVILWAVLIATTPQVVSLDGSVLTIHTLGGMERFDLADGLQLVDVVGNPRTSYWAVLLHRPNGTTLTLRHNDVVAVELDPIVRHYRMVASQRFAERQARFNL